MQPSAYPLLREPRNDRIQPPCPQNPRFAAVAPLRLGQGHDGAGPIAAELAHHIGGGRAGARSRQALALALHHLRGRRPRADGRAAGRRRCWRTSPMQTKCAWRSSAAASCARRWWWRGEPRARENPDPGVGAAIVGGRVLPEHAAGGDMRWAMSPTGSPNGAPIDARVKEGLGLDAGRAHRGLSLYRKTCGAAGRTRAARSGLADNAVLIFTSPQGRSSESRSACASAATTAIADGQGNSPLRRGYWLRAAEQSIGCRKKCSKDKPA